MASPDLPDETVAATAGGRTDSGLPVVRARVRVYRPRRYRVRAFIYGFVIAVLMVAGLLVWLLR